MSNREVNGAAKSVDADLPESFVAVSGVAVGQASTCDIKNEIYISRRNHGCNFPESITCFLYR